MPLSDYLDDQDGIYRFPDLKTAWAYEGQLPEESFFTVDNRQEEIMLTRFQKIFGF